MALEQYDMVLEQLEGGSLGLLFTGGSLPQQGVGAPIEQRKTVTQYPGSSETSTQFMGSTDGDIQLSGMWRDEFAGVEGYALEQVNVARALVSQGLRCRLVWGPYLTREGWVKMVEPTYNRPERIQYRITFEVDVSQETSVDLVDVEPVQYDVAIGLQEVIEAVEDAVEVAGTLSTVAQAVLL